MSNHTKVWLIVAGALILAGGLLFTFALSRCNWDFSKLSTTQLVSTTHEISGSFRNIIIDTDRADILFMPSTDDTCRVECFEEETARHTVEIREDALTIENHSRVNYIGYIGISPPRPKITVHLPKREYNELAAHVTTGDVVLPREFVFTSIDISGTTGDITVRASAEETMKVDITTGDILVEELSAGSMELAVTTGDIAFTDILCTGDIATRTTTGRVRMTGVRCNHLQSRGGSGAILLEDVITSGLLSLKQTTGDIKLDSCDATELLITCTTGDITGTLLSDKIFMTHTNTGSVEVPKTITGGKCEISTTTGDIKITIP